MYVCLSMYTYCAHTHVCIDDIYVHTQIHAMCVHVYILAYIPEHMYPYTGGRAYGGTAGVAEASKADTNAPAAGPVRHTIGGVFGGNAPPRRVFLREASNRIFAGGDQD